MYCYLETILTCCEKSTKKAILADTAAINRKSMCCGIVRIRVPERFLGKGDDRKRENNWGYLEKGFLLKKEKVGKRYEKK